MNFDRAIKVIDCLYFDYFILSLELKDEVTLSREFFESETKQRVDALAYQTESLGSRHLLFQL